MEENDSIGSIFFVFLFFIEMFSQFGILIFWNFCYFQIFQKYNIHSIIDRESNVEGSEFASYRYRHQYI